MRDIKFRAWDLDHKHMIESGELIFNEHSEIEEQFMDECHVFMQYTGLKDKNGVDIYEGDIVKALGKDGGEVMGDIEYGEGEYHVNNQLHDYPEWPCASVPILCAFEVIGNKYSNPELLETTS